MGVFLLLHVLGVVSVVVDGRMEGMELSSLSSPLTDYAYQKFIERARSVYAEGTYSLYGIPVLKSSASDYPRFYTLTLGGRDGEQIALAVDVLDLTFAAYRADNKSYFFPNAAPDAFIHLFTDTDRSIMNFNNTHQSLEAAAGTTRSQIYIGRVPVNTAVVNLFHHRRQQVPAAFLVLIQVILDAAKFKLIQNAFSNCFMFKTDIIPSRQILSLEDAWSELSTQIQASKSLSGLFGKTITLYNSNDEPFEVDSIYYPILLTNIALLEYQCQRVSTTRDAAKYFFIRMPSDDDDGGESYNNINNNQNDACLIETRTTRISGKNGLCVSVPARDNSDSGALMLNPCREEADQKWTFKSDGTIRTALGKCLTASPRFGNNALVSNCDGAIKDEISWQVSSTGMIKNPSYNRVLTADATSSNNILTMEGENTNAIGQYWRLGDDVEPIVVKITAFVEWLCLETAANKRQNVWLEKCVKNKAEQYWALYSDGTIRVNNNRALCVTAPPLSGSSRELFIGICSGIPHQRWILKVDGPISNPETNMQLQPVPSAFPPNEIVITEGIPGEERQWWMISN